MCFIPPSPVFFRLLLTWGAPLLRLVLFQPRSARLLGYFYNDTLCNVNYCRRNELEEVFQDAASPHFSLSFLSRCYPPSLSFSFLLVSGAGMSKGCFLSLSLVILGTDTSRISALPRTSTELISLRDSFAHASPGSRLVSVPREVHFYFSLPELDSSGSLRMRFDRDVKVFRHDHLCGRYVQSFRIFYIYI